MNIAISVIFVLLWGRVAPCSPSPRREDPYRETPLWTPKKILEQKVCNLPQDWVCNPDGLIEIEEKEDIERHFRDNPLKDPEDGCPIHMHLVLLKDVQEEYFAQKADLSITFFNPTQSLQWFEGLELPHTDRNCQSNVCCCKSLLLVTRLVEGRLHYAAAMCKRFRMCDFEVRNMFQLNAGAVYDKRYTYMGYKLLWDAIADQYQTNNVCPKRANSKQLRPWATNALISIALGLLALLHGLL